MPSQCVDCVDHNDPTAIAWAPCPLCSMGVDNPLHLFTQCVIARTLWRQSLYSSAEYERIGGISTDGEWPKISYAE